MPNSGSGSGTPIPSGGAISNTIPDAVYHSCISLSRYAQLTSYSDCAIHGVNYSGDDYDDCGNRIWSQTQRDTIQYYLAEAQLEIENVLGYPVCATYFEREEHPYQFPIHTRHKRIIELGQRVESEIEADAVIDYSVEPASIGPIVTTVTDTDEIKVFYVDSAREIEPSAVTIENGELTIRIPRCRLVASDLFDNPNDGHDYTDLDNFTAFVDVRRVYTDTTVNADIVWLHQNNAGNCPQCGCLSCNEHTETACALIHNARTGAVGPLHATYSGNSWQPTCGRCFSRYPDKVRLYYKAGLETLDLRAENSVLRLAHAKMPNAPCGCDVLQSLWKRDTNIPQVLTRERENCPFGMSDGAWTAWKFVNSIAHRGMYAWG